MTILGNYQFDAKAPVVHSVLNLFDIKPGQLDFKTHEQR